MPAAVPELALMLLRFCEVEDSERVSLVPLLAVSVAVATEATTMVSVLVLFLLLAISLILMLLVLLLLFSGEGEEAVLEMFALSC